MEQNLVHGPGDIAGEPLRLPQYAKRFLYRLYEFDPRTRVRLARKALLGVAKGNIKTELMAAVAIEQLAGPTAPVSPEVKIAAASFEQADILFGTAAFMIREGSLRDFFHVFDTEIIPKDQPGVLKRVAAAAGTNDGGRTTCFIADELHEWVGGKERVHLVISNALAKRRDGLELNISTAGADLDTLLGRLYEKGRKIAAGEIVDPRFLFEWWEADAKWDLHDREQRVEAIREANPATDDFLDAERVADRFDEIAEHEFIRYYTNRWVQAAETWIPSDRWAACAGGAVPKDGTPIVAGFDGSDTLDSTAIYGATLGAQPHIFTIAAWENPGRKDWHVPRAEVDAAVARMFKRWDVQSFECDPRDWMSEIQDWADLYGEDKVLTVPQNNERMAPAADAFRAAVMAGELTHDGDPALARHIANAKTRETRWGLAIRKDHPASPRKIDRAIAAILAHAAAVRRPEPPKELLIAWR